MPFIKLKSSDGELFEVDVEIAKVSITLKTMLDNLGMDPADDEPIELSKVSAATLGKVLEWATYHNDDPPRDESAVVSSMPNLDIDQWDKEFLDVDQTELFDLLVAANYLDIKGLYEASCKTVANMIRGKTPEEIRATFGILSDFTREEEEQIRRENSWSEEKPTTSKSKESNT